MARFSRFLFGGIVGAGVALLLAPKPGRELRRMLMGGGRPALLPPEEPLLKHSTIQAKNHINLESRIEETRRQVETQLATAPEVTAGTAIAIPMPSSPEAPVAAEAAPTEAGEPEPEPVTPDVETTGEKLEEAAPAIPKAEVEFEASVEAALVEEDYVVEETAPEAAVEAPVGETSPEAPVEEAPVEFPSEELEGALAEEELAVVQEEAAEEEEMAAEEEASVAEFPGRADTSLAELAQIEPDSDEFAALRTPVEGEPTMGEGPEAAEPVVEEPPAEEPVAKLAEEPPVEEPVAELTEEPPVEEPPAAAPAKPEPSRMDQDEMRRRIDETRARLKAKAFDAMVSGETFIETEADKARKKEKLDKPELDKEIDQQIDESLKEEF